MESCFDPSTQYSRSFFKNLCSSYLLVLVVTFKDKQSIREQLTKQPHCMKGLELSECVCVCFFFLGGGEGINPIGMNNNQSYAKVVSRLKHDISLYFILAPNPGHVCLVHRGSCSFLLKAKHCSDAGAVGVIVVNGAGQSMVVMTGVCAQNDCPQYNSMPKIIHGISWLELRTSSKSKTAICSWNIIFQTNFWTGQGVQPFSAPGSILQQKPQATTLRSSSMA